MKKCIWILLLSVSQLASFSQTKPKTPAKAPTKSDMDEMMKQAQAAMDALSPEERRMMDSMGIKIPSMGSIPKITDKQMAAASAASKTKAGTKTNPVAKANIAVIQTQQQLSTYLAGLLTDARKNLDGKMMTDVDGMLSKSRTPGNIPMALLLAKNVKAAVYAGLKSAQQAPTQNLALNNCGFLLQQAGYPDKAIPVLKYLLQTIKSPVVMNNLGQAYLSLDQKEEAKKYFMMGLAINPGSAEMHCGMAALLAQEGNKTEASVHIKKALKNSYSEEAEELAEKNGIKLSFDDLKRPVPEYFNTNKFKPSLPMMNADEWPVKQAEFAAQQDRADKAKEKAEKLGSEMAAGLDPSKSMKGLKQVAAYWGQTAMAKRALGMQQLITDDQGAFYAKEFAAFKTRSDAAYAAFDKEFERIQHASYKDKFERCDAHTKNLNNYLQITKQYADAYQRAALPKINEWSNQQVYWQAFLASGQAYEATEAVYTASFFAQINALSSLQQTHPMPEWVINNCKNNKEEKAKYQLETAEGLPDCPANIKLGLAEFASVKFSCEGMEVELGAKGIKFGWEENARTGEFTISFGLGADVDALLVQAGAKGVVYFKMGKDGPVDMGLKGEAGVEMNVGPINIEEKIVAVMGVSSLNVDAVHQGKENNIFSMDAMKD